MGKVGCDIWEKWVGGRKKKKFLQMVLLELLLELLLADGLEPLADVLGGGVGWGVR